MLGLVAIFATSLLVGLSGAMMPGPVLTITISESYKRGFWAGPLIVLGHAILELILVVGLALGLSSVLRSSYLSGSIGIVGSFFLIWMGSNIIRSVIREEVKFSTQFSGNNPTFGPIIAGITVSLSNPYWTIWWATVGVGFVLKSLRYKFLGLTFFYGGHILADLLWYSLISLAVVTGKRFLSDRVYRDLLFFCGLFLIAVAVFFAYSGVKFFLN